MKRSDFLKLSCTGCLLGAAGLVSVTELLSCAPGTAMKIYKAQLAGKIITVPEAEVVDGKLSIIRSKGMEYDIALRRLSAGKYEALLLRCTHFSNPLTVSGQGYYCSLHGSRFDENGQVQNGPASVPLTQLPCSISGGNILIHV